MEGIRQACPVCGAVVSARARWCARCHHSLALGTEAQALERGIATPPATAPARRWIDSSEPESKARIRLWGTRLAFVALLLGGPNLQTWLTRPEVATSDVTRDVANPAGYVVMGSDAATGAPVRYDPCTPIPYVINPTEAPPGGVEDVQTAVRLTAEASGLRFVYEGETAEVPSEDRAPYQPDRYGSGWAPVVFGWVPTLGPTDPNGLSPLGRGGSKIERNEDGELVYVTGHAAFNSSANLPAGFAGESWGQVYLHEIGHVVGLGHNPDPESVMNAVHGVRPAVWGPGDRRGLWELGLGGGCVTAPVP